MFKVSFSDGLAIVGIALTVVLVVLDKAGKLKGPVLLALLVGAAVMTLPLAWGISWVGGATGILRFIRASFMFFLVGLIYSSIAVWISTGTESVAEKEPDAISPQETRPNIDQERPRLHGVTPKSESTGGTVITEKSTGTSDRGTASESAVNLDKTKQTHKVDDAAKPTLNPDQRGPGPASHGISEKVGSGPGPRSHGVVADLSVVVTPATAKRGALTVSFQTSGAGEYDP